LGAPGALRSQKRPPLNPRVAKVSQEDTKMYNCCIKERKEERKMRGPRGA
jgi:hypothetical protein